MLNDKEKKTVTEELNRLKSLLEKELKDGDWKKERKQRRELYENILSTSNIDNMTESGFKKVVTSLWASRIWGNKNYFFEQILQRTDFGDITSCLKDLLYGKRQFEDRFDNFINTVKGLGGSSVTEILVFIYPEQYCLWNDKPKNVLPVLGIKSLPDRVFKYSLKNGKDYMVCNKAMTDILEIMKKNGYPEADFLDLDIFMWASFNDRKKEIKGTPGKRLGTEAESFKIKTEKGYPAFTHEDAQALLLELGRLLGYSTYTPDRGKTSKLFKEKLGKLALLNEIPAFASERHLETVRYIDVVWFDVETPKYFFEVELSTGITEGLLRLYQTRIFHTGLFVISPEDKFEKFKKELRKDPFISIQDRFKFRSFKELYDLFKIAGKFGTARDEFFA